jgi:hypothetical protein
LTLFRVDPAGYGAVYGNAPRKERRYVVGCQASIGFADSSPVHLHLLNLASVREVAIKVKEDIPSFSARRFGPQHPANRPTGLRWR